MLLIRNAIGGKLKKFIAWFVVATFFVAFAPALATAPPERAQVIIVFKERPNAALITGLGGEVLTTYEIIPGLAARVPIGALEELGKNPAIAYIDPDAIVHALEQQVPWGINRIGAPSAWSSSTGAGVKVAILDTGIQHDHPDLAANVKGGISVVGNENSTDPVDWDDGHGHGTHVAGIVAAVNNDVGVVGSAPDAWLYAVKVFEYEEGPVSDVIDGIDWCVQNGMQVLNMSLGTDVHVSSFEEACDQAHEAGLLLVASAGNLEEAQPPYLCYPAAYDNVIAVSATDSNDQAPYWSNSGPFVELAAPGADVPSTWKDSEYRTKNGTSMAAPHVSGTAALVWAWNPSLTNVQLRSILQQTAEDLGPAGRDTVYGYGIVRADEAVPTYGVEVSISPSGQSAPRRTTLEYTVSVINQGNVADNYALTVSDNAGWGPTLSYNSLTIPRGENGIATLTVVIPENAVNGMEDNITVVTTSQTDNTASDSASCIAEAFVTASAWSSENLPYDHVILIVIDGVRPDVLQAANTPNFDNLTAEGSFTWNAWTVIPSVTIAAIPSIYTGATPEVHGVTDWDGEIYAETIVEVFEEAGLPCAIVGQDPILGGYSATYCTGHYSHPHPDEHFMSIAIDLLWENDFYFISIYNPVPDKRGHEYGHDSPEYREAIENADYHVGRLVENLKELGVYENTLIVITTDHGMTGKSHSAGYETDMRIFSIWRGPGVKENYQMVDNVYIPPFEGGYARVQIHAVDNDSWSEYGITWNIQPKLGEILIDNVLVNTVGWHSWNMTNFIAEQFNKDEIASIAMVDMDENLSPDHSAAFETKEWENVAAHPYLEVQYSPPGEPTSTIQIEPIEDSYVHQDVPDSNFGGATYLSVGRYRDGAERAFLKFDLGAIPVGSSIIEASYHNYCWRLSPGGGYGETWVAHRIIDIAPTMTSSVGLRAPENSEGDVIYQIFQKADIKLENIYTIKLDVDLSLGSGSKLVVKFYTYAGDNQGENVVWSGTTPAQVVLLKNIPHPENGTVENATLLLTDDVGSVISTITSFVARKSDLIVRISAIKGRWALALPPEKTALIREISDIKGQWSYAPG